MILIFTGNGKGKTTAALGHMLRALGRGRNALMIQFIKGPWRSGEDEFAERFGIRDSGFGIVKTGKGFVGILGDKLPREEHVKAAEEGLEYFKKEKDSGKWDLIVLDEINVAAALGLLKPEAVLTAIKDFPPDKVLILTGRDAPKEFIEVAELVTEMKEIKHPFQEGKKAKPVIDF
jgi:cob(I)alamin adenosyltransferase